MSVYVDDMRAKFGNMVMCHMIADSTPELLNMAERVGVKAKWIQKAGTPSEHFDICLSKRELAVCYGAIPITQRQLGRILLARRGLRKFERPNPNAWNNRFQKSRDELPL